MKSMGAQSLNDCSYWTLKIFPPQSSAMSDKSLSEPMIMMTSSNGNFFRVTGPLCGEFTGHGEFPAQRPVTRSFDVFFDLRLNKQLSKQCEAGDLRRYRGHYDVIVMMTQFTDTSTSPWLYINKYTTDMKLPIWFIWCKFMQIGTDLYTICSHLSFPVWRNLFFYPNFSWHLYNSVACEKLPFTIC